MTDTTPEDPPSGDEDGLRAVGRHGEPTDRARDRKGVIAFMARNGVAANLLMLFMLVTGLYAFNTIVQEVFPEASLDTISVSVAYPGATPEEIEESVVQKIEESVESVEGVKEIRATANEGFGTVLVELEVGTDISRALDDVKSEVDQIQTFPIEAEEPDVREVTTRQSVMRIAIFGNAPEQSLKEVAYELEDGLSSLRKVSYVQTSGIREYRVYIDIPQDRLRALGLSLNDVSRSVSANSLDSPAGSIETDSEEVRVRTVGQNYRQGDFEDIILVSSPDGTTLRIGDIANVDDSFEDNDVISSFNGMPVAFVDVYRTSDERVLDVTEAAGSYLENEFAPTLPEGISYAIWDDDSYLFRDRLGLLVRNGLIGLGLVIAALTLFLNLRLALWTAAGIGITFVGAFFILEQFGSSLNAFSLFGFILALGLVVDDAVVVGENVYSERERGRSGIGAAIAGAQRVRTPVIFAVATTIASFSPIFALGGVFGKVFSDVPLVVIAVLGLSLVEALLILPYHLSSLPPAGTRAKYRITRAIESVQLGFDRRFQAFVQGPLDRALRFAVSMPYLVLATGLAMLIVLFAMIPGGLIKATFFPEIEADTVVANLELPAGTTIDRTAEVVDRIEAAGERALARFGEDDEDQPDFFKARYTTIGFQNASFGPGGGQTTFASNIANVSISLISGEKRDVSAREIENAWREELGPVPEARSLTIRSSLIDFGEPINLRLSHPDQAVLDEALRRIMNELAQIDGVFDIESDQSEGMQEIQLRLKPSARTLGVTLQDVASQVRAAFFGAEAVRVQRGREDVRVYVRLPEDERDSIADIEKFRVRVPEGDVALGTLADVSFSIAPSVIRREGGRRVTTITADVDADTVTGQEVADLLNERVIPEVTTDYPGLLIDFGGEQQERSESFSSLGTAFLLALAAIYALLAIPFRSYVQPMVIMAAIPFGMIGALIGHLLLDIPLGILSAFGIIALSGVIINGSLVLIDFVNENIDNGMEPAEAVIDAAKSRFRPIILTALTTFLGVAPITFETSLQAQFLIPMSASLGFGILFGTVLLQLLIPALAILQIRASARIGRFLHRMGNTKPADAEFPANAAES